jgi:putative acetyltransferase
MIKPKDIRIRGEKSKDISDIHALNIAAFKTDAEAMLVDRLREKKEFFLSIVAEYRKKIVGHILFTPVDVEHNPQKIKAAGLAPMAVSPQLQNHGIGSALIHNGLTLCAQSGYEVVFVLGHETYYPRFGFMQARSHDLYYRSEDFYPYFFFIDLGAGNLDDLKGEVSFDPEFDGV